MTLESWQWVLAAVAALVVTTGDAWLELVMVVVVPQWAQTLLVAQVVQAIQEERAVARMAVTLVVQAVLEPMAAAVAAADSFLAVLVQHQVFLGLQLLGH